MSADVSALQNAVNRFAAVGNFPKLAVDGQFGALTRAGTTSALRWIATSNTFSRMAAEGLLDTWDGMADSAAGLATFLTQTADTVGLPHVASPIVMPTTIPSVPLIPSTALATISVFDRFRAWPLWQQLVTGAFAAISMIWVANRIKRGSK